MIDVDIEADVKEATAHLKKYERQVIPKAITRSLNGTIRNVKTAAHRKISKRTGLMVKEINANSQLQLSQFRRLYAILSHRRRAFNLRRFVSTGKLAVGAFQKQRGVVANPWRNRRLFEHSFIIRGRTHGKLVVVRRTTDERYPLRGLYGPSLHVEFNRPAMRRYMNIIAKKRFRINFERDLNYYLSRL